MTVKAAPAFRLIVRRDLADVPSRLLVLYARIETTGNDALYLDPARLRLILPDGRRARVLDPPRAAALLRSTKLARWDLGYTTKPRHTPGGLSSDLERRLRRKISGALLQATDFGPQQGVSGYFIADAGVPLRSLEDVALEIVVTRVRDASAVRNRYVFAGQKTLTP